VFLKLGSNTYININLTYKIGLDPRFNNILLDYPLGIDLRFNNILNLLDNDVLLEFTLGADLGFNNILLQRRLLNYRFNLLSFTRASNTFIYVN